MIPELVARVRLRKCRSVGESPRVLGRIWVRGDGTVRIGKRVVLDARTAPIELHATFAHSEIIIGDDVTLGGGTSVQAEESVRIGDRTRIGAYCRLMDSHFHPVIGDRSKRPRPTPLVIENDVSIGTRSIMLAGTYLEHDVLVCPGTVVTRRIRAHATVRGVPCQIVGEGREVG